MEFDPADADHVGRIALVARAEAEERDRLRTFDWATINQALMAVTRAMSRWNSVPGERERHTERVMTRY